MRLKFMKGDFFNWPKCQKDKRPTNQPEAFLAEGFHGTAARVGTLEFFYFGTERGGAVKESPCICIYCVRMCKCVCLWVVVLECVCLLSVCVVCGGSVCLAVSNVYLSGKFSFFAESKTWTELQTSCCTIFTLNIRYWVLPSLANFFWAFLYHHH